MVVQVAELKVSLVEGEKHWKKAFEDMKKVCRDFKENRKALQQKKDD